MFGKLKEKLKSWTKNLSKTAEPEEEIQEEKEIVETEKPGEKEEIREKTKSELKKEKRAKEKTKKELKKKSEKELKDLEKEIKKDKSISKETRKELIKELKKDKAEEIEEEIEEIEEKYDNEIDSSMGRGRSGSGGGALPDSKEQLLEKSDNEEQIKETPKQKSSFFKNIITSKVKISEKDFEVYEEELELLLLENNVALEVAEKIVKQLREEIVGKEFLKKEVAGQIEESFKDIIREILIEPFNLIDKIKEFRMSSEGQNKPYVILFCGINGTGKTTSIAKIAQQLKDNNLKPALAAADTFRAASIEQIKTHGERLNVPVIAHEYNSDPASVGFDAIKYAEKNGIDTVLIDTAGRMYTEKNLMAQIEKIAKVTNPQTKIFVGESTTGNDIVEQVKSFDWAIHIDGIILSKADIDEKGGTALSVGYVTKKPILYLGTGQEYEKIEPFDKEKFIEKLGLGDD